MSVVDLATTRDTVSLPFVPLNEGPRISKWMIQVRMKGPVSFSTLVGVEDPDSFKFG